MGKNIFCALIIAGLCFGQSIWLKENQKINLPMPINGAIGSTNGMDGIAERKVLLYSSQNLSLIKFLGPNVLFMQVEGESLQPKTSFWKQTGIYGLELLGAGVGTGLSYIGLQSFVGERRLKEVGSVPLAIVYTITNTILTSTTTSLVGKIFNQRCSWWQSTIGAGLGSTISSLVYFNYHRYYGAEHCIYPPIGAVIGYNWKNDKSLRQIGIYSFEFLGAGAGTGLSFCSLAFIIGFSRDLDEIGTSVVFSYTLSNMLFTGTTTFLTGKLFNQRGSWWKTAIGAGLGGFISSYTIINHRGETVPRGVQIICAILPPISALVGYNWR